jgi:hypothetical protein
MKIPENMDSADIAPDDPYRFGIDFECSVCGRKFYLACGDYEGQWDHPPNEPICRQCEYGDEL